MNVPTEYLEIISKDKALNWENHTYYKVANENHFWIDGRFSNFLQCIQKLNIKTDKTLTGLDIGCGNCVTSTMIEKCTEWTVHGADLDLSGLKYKNQGRGKVFLYDILEKNEKFREQYDFLVLFDVLEHIKDTQSFLKACLFHLKSNGYLFINVPALPFLMSSYDTVQGHYRRYTKKSLFILLHNTNIQVLNHRYWGFLMLLPAYLRKLKPEEKGNVDEIISNGFQPKNDLIHNILRLMIKFELHCLPKSLIGTSLMAITQKRSKWL